MQIIDKTILIVEDDKSSAGVLQSMLSRVFSNILIGFDGSEGMELYYIHKPDLIITDLSMPVMSGYDMITQIRTSDSKTPIVVSTAFREEAELVKTFVNHVLYKPVIKKDLYECIENIMKIKLLP